MLDPAVGGVSDFTFACGRGLDHGWKRHRGGVVTGEGYRGGPWMCYFKFIYFGHGHVTFKYSTMHRENAWEIHVKI